MRFRRYSRFAGGTTEEKTRPGSKRLTRKPLKNSTRAKRAARPRGYLGVGMSRANGQQMPLLVYTARGLGDAPLFARMPMTTKNVYAFAAGLIHLHRRLELRVTGLESWVAN